MFGLIVPWGRFRTSPQANHRLPDKESKLRAAFLPEMSTVGSISMHISHQIVADVGKRLDLLASSVAKMEPHADDAERSVI